MIIVGIDPSYTRTGVSIIDTDDKTIEFNSYGLTIGGKTFRNIYIAATDCVLSISALIPDFVDCIISETPPPGSEFGAGLYGLDILLLRTLEDQCDELYGVSPTYVGHIHGKRKYTKTESVELVKSLIPLFERYDYKVKYSGRLSNDEAESFIFAIRMFVKNFKDDTITKEILSRYKNFKNEKEFSLK